MEDNQQYNIPRNVESHRAVRVDWLFELEHRFNTHTWDDILKEFDSMTKKPLTKSQIR